MQQFRASNSPRNARLVELGPGRGTLMADILGVFKQLRLLQGGLQSVHLVETSDSMWERQQERLAPVLKDTSVRLVRHQSFEELFKEPSTDVFTMITAHEFFDALPVYVIQVCTISLSSIFSSVLNVIFQKAPQAWHEVMVTTAQQAQLKPDNDSQPASPELPPLKLMSIGKPTAMSQQLGASSPRFKTKPLGSQVEVCPTAYKIARQVAEFIGEHSTVGGSALFIDYGDDKAFGDSLRVRS